MVLPGGQQPHPVNLLGPFQGQITAWEQNKTEIREDKEPRHAEQLALAAQGHRPSRTDSGSLSMLELTEQVWQL